MAKNFVQPGKVLPVTATAIVASGTFQVVGEMFGIAATSAKAGEEYELALGECYEQPKATGEAWAVGQTIYWNATTKAMTTTAGSNKKVGIAAYSAASSAGKGVVRLNEVF